MNSLRGPCGLCLLLFCLLGLNARAAVPAGSPISPYLIGQNYWYNPPDSAYPIIGTSGVKMIRIGGKAYDDTPLSDANLLRQVDNIRSIGAEPLIQVSRHKGAAVAAATVTYLNVTHSRGVKFWSIGNEPDLNWTGTEAELVSLVETYTKAISVAMRDVDPSIRICSSDMASYSTSKFEALLGGANDITGKDPKGRYYVDNINLHRYPFSNVITRAAVLAELHGSFESRISAMVGRIAYANTFHGRTGDAALTWGLTEFNLTYKNPDTSINNVAGLGVSSFLNGQFFAEYYRVGMKHGAQMMTTWSLMEGGGNGSTTDFGFIGGSWASPVMRSSFYHMQMVALHMLPGTYVPSSSTVPNLAVLSTRRTAGGQLAVMLLNEDASAHQAFTLRMNDEPVLGAGAKVSVSGGIAREFSASLENQSSVVLLFDATGTLRQSIHYSLTRNRLNLPPLVRTYPLFTRAPSAPTDLCVQAGDGSLSLNWSSGAAESFTVRRAPAGSDAFTTLVTGLLVPSYTDGGLTNGVGYRYVVSAVNALGESPVSIPAEGAPEARTLASAVHEAESLSLFTSGSTSSVVAEGTASSGSWVQLNASAPDPFLEFTTPSLPAGAYRFQLAYKANNNRGQARLSIDGVTVGDPLDQYATSPSFTSVVVGRVNFASAGTHVVRLACTGKNASSSGYLISADRFDFLAPEPVYLVLGNLLQSGSAAPTEPSLQGTPSEVPISLSYDGSASLPSLPGSYKVVARSNSPDYFGATSGTLSISATPLDPSLLVNLSVRTTLAANQVLTVGLVMQGGEKPVLLRAAGPALAAFGVTDTMPDPRVTLFKGTTAIDANDDWAGNPALASAISAVRAFPYTDAASRDAGLLALIEGNRTLEVSGPTGGNVIVEAYDAGSGANPHLVNLSALNFVGTGNDILTAGLTLAGSGTKTLLIRAVGPSLQAFGVPGTMANPMLEVFSTSNGPVKIAENDDHASTLAPVAQQVGAFPLNAGSTDASLLIDLPAGTYTVQVSGVGGGTGVAIVEVYEVP